MLIKETFLKIFLLLSIIQYALCKSPVKVSIIIPVYNTGPYLKRCLKSAIKQTLKEIEIICVDDASTDTSLSILKIFQRRDPRIKVVHLDKNQGPSTARNKGLELATGEFLGFMDSDDYADEQYFENLYNQAGDYDVITGEYVRSTNKSNSYIHMKHKRHHGSLYDSIWRREFINKHNVKFNVNRWKGEDVRFRKDCYKFKPKILKLPDQGIYYYYKMRPGSLSKFKKNTLNEITRLAEAEKLKMKEL
ncbi:glycosyltransferase family 2 protein [Piromyces sp. E2]|nr:glycosyltransferase family 2 protein [Piromyces sp. E2]|eukprot:OUM57602.1 glycosyltransferase family 2 protein [Piromyces sp. E2]